MQNNPLKILSTSILMLPLKTCAQIMIFMGLLFVCPAHAFKFTSRTCTDYQLGDNWYCTIEPENVRGVYEETKITAEDILNSKVSPEQKAKLLNELWELQTKRAVITGSREDLRNVLITQRLIAKKGVDFARNIQALIETTPEFASNESYYKNISEAASHDFELKNALEGAHKDHAIAFIYSSRCGLCSRQLPILLALKDKWNIDLLGVSVDGGYYEGIPENVTDKEIINDPNVQGFPTLVLLNKKERSKIFLSKGLATLDQLETKIFNRIKEATGENNG